MSYLNMNCRKNYFPYIVCISAKPLLYEQERLWSISTWGKIYLLEHLDYTIVLYYKSRDYENLSLCIFGNGYFSFLLMVEQRNTKGHFIYIFRYHISAFLSHFRPKETREFPIPIDFDRRNISPPCRCNCDRRNDRRDDRWDRRDDRRDDRCDRRNDRRDDRRDRWERY